MIRRAVITLLGLLMLSGVAAAHQDRIFQVQPSGEVMGIATKFGKVFIILRRAAGHTAVTIKIGKTTSALPRCLAKWFSSRKKLFVAGSWWHKPGRSSLPPYVGIRADYAAKHTVDLLFSLTTGKLLDASEHIVTGKNSSRSAKLRGCSAAAIKRLK